MEGSSRSGRRSLLGGGSAVQRLPRLCFPHLGSFITSEPNAAIHCMFARNCSVFSFAAEKINSISKTLRQDNREPQEDCQQIKEFRSNMLDAVEEELLSMIQSNTLPSAKDIALSPFFFWKSSAHSHF